MARKIAVTKKTAAAKREIELKYNAPQARVVSVAGTFNNWDTHSLLAAKGRNGNWTVKVALTPGNYEYKFIVDGSWLNDPNCKESVPNSLGSSNNLLVVK